jgi:hypothetical protein
MDEYAIMRRKLACRIAARLPQAMEASGSTARRPSMGWTTGVLPNTRSVASSTPALMTVAM